MDWNELFHLKHAIKILHRLANEEGTINKPDEHGWISLKYEDLNQVRCIIERHIIDEENPNE